MRNTSIVAFPRLIGRSAAALAILFAAVCGAVFAASGHHDQSLTALARGASAPVRPDLSCSSSGPCLKWFNSNSGAALEGISVLGKGIIGQTKFNGGTTPDNGKAGVNGQDISTVGKFNSGVRGFSDRGYGVFGDSTEGSGVFGRISDPTVVGALAGVLGDDVSGSGTFDSGVEGMSSENTGVTGISQFGAGVAAQGSSYGVAAQADNGFAGLFQSFGSGAGLEGFSQKFTGVIAATATPMPALTVESGFGSQVASAGTPLITATWLSAPFPSCGSSSGTGELMSLDQVGNMILCGSLTQNSTPLIVSKTTTGGGEMTYGAQSTQPTIEDVGEAQLVSGRSVVDFDAPLARAIDARHGYLVFLTPQGPTTGSLYVATKTASGFTVGETQGGRSTVAFDYRIVAKPFGSNAPRLPVVHALFSPQTERATQYLRAVSRRGATPTALLRVRHRL